MSTIDLIYAAVLGLASCLGLYLQSRRDHLAERVQALEAANSPTNDNLHARVFALEQWQDRCRRNT